MSSNQNVFENIAEDLKEENQESEIQFEEIQAF